MFVFQLCHNAFLQHRSLIDYYVCLHLMGSFFSTFSASEWTVPTTFIYGYQDWMNYQGAQEARKLMNVPCEIIRVPQVSLSLPPLSLSLSLSINVLVIVLACLMLRKTDINLKYFVKLNCRLGTSCS